MTTFGLPSFSPYFTGGTLSGLTDGLEPLRGSSRKLFCLPMSLDPLRREG